MDRRVFVKATSAAGALAWLAGRQPLGAQVSSSYSNAVPFVLDPSLTGLMT